MSTSMHTYRLRRAKYLLEQKRIYTPEEKQQQDFERKLAQLKSTDSLSASSVIVGETHRMFRKRDRMPSRRSIGAF